MSFDQVFKRGGKFDLPSVMFCFLRFWFKAVGVETARKYFILLGLIVFLREGEGKPPLNNVRSCSSQLKHFKTLSQRFLKLTLSNAKGIVLYTSAFPTAQLICSIHIKKNLANVYIFP